MVVPQSLSLYVPVIHRVASVSMLNSSDENWVSVESGDSMDPVKLIMAGRWGSVVQPRLAGAHQPSARAERDQAVLGEGE